MVLAHLFILLDGCSLHNDLNNISLLFIHILLFIISISFDLYINGSLKYRCILRTSVYNTY